MSNKTQTRNEVLVQDLHTENAATQLPKNVFLISLKTGMNRRTDNDEVFVRNGSPVEPPDFPVKVRLPKKVPRMDPRKVYFRNPAEISNQSRKTWEFDNFVEKFREAIRLMKDLDPEVRQRVYLESIRLVEIPKEYVEESEQGYHEASKDLYEDRVKMTIGTFGKRPTIQNDEIREQLGLPGKVIQPLRLTKLKEVNAKEYRGTNNTSAVSTKRFYFTEGQAEQYNKLNLTPTVYGDGNNAASLELAIQNIGSYMPSLMESQFMHEVEFIGEIVDKETFKVNDANIL